MVMIEVTRVFRHAEDGQKPKAYAPGVHAVSQACAQAAFAAGFAIPSRLIEAGRACTYFRPMAEVVHG